MRISLDFNFILNFDEPITEHKFAIKVVPQNRHFQEVEGFKLNMELSHTIDGFNNIISYGCFKEPTDKFEISISSKIKIVDEYREYDEPSGIYLYPSHHTKFTDTVANFYSKVSNLPEDKYKKILYLNSLVHDSFEFNDGSSNLSSVEVMLKEKKGRSRDFGHLLITLLRKEGFYARYANGFTEYKKQSHSWVEVYHNDCWIGIDPGENIVIKEDPYVKIAQGRDHLDATMSKSIFFGGKVKDKIEELNIKRY